MQRSAFIKGTAVAAMLSVAMMAWAASSAGQGVKPVPGPGTGIVTVEGTVNVGNTPVVMVGNTPMVNAVQGGAWKVAASVPNPDFLQLNRSYTVTWPDGGTQSVVVAEVGSNGWVRVENPGRRRWINLGQVLSVQEGSESAR
jgi:hypothetical protein